MTIPGYSMVGWYWRIYRGVASSTRTSRSATSPSARCTTSSTRSRRRSRSRHQPHLRGPVVKIQKSYLVKDPESIQPHIRAFVERRSSSPPARPATAPAQRGAPGPRRSARCSIADAWRCRSATWPDLRRSTTRRSPAHGRAAGYRRLVGRDRAGLPLAGPRVGHAVGRRGAAREDGAPSRLRLTDVTYVFDEPTVGLHPHDIQQMNDLLLRLRDKGNTVLVVEHKPETIAIADHVDRPRARRRARAADLFEGSVAGAAGRDAVTGRHLDDRGGPRMRAGRRRATWRSAARTNNLQDVDVDIPLGVIVVVTGVAGSGQELADPRVAPGRATRDLVDQCADPRLPAQQPGHLHRHPRPDPQGVRQGQRREAGAVQRQLRGRLPECGLGAIYTDLAMMAGVATMCEVCEGRRFRPRSWSTSCAGRTSAEVLALSVAEARDFFSAGEPRYRPP